MRANHLLTGRSRLVTVKTRVVRHTGALAPLAAHLGYLRREGVTRDGEKARLFGPETEDADPKAFAERCEKDRHHFRFIVSPEDAPEMADLKGFARELVGQMEKDLGTKLDWVAVDHWNTAASRTSTSSCAASPTTARTSSSRATTSRKGCAPAPRTW